MPKRKLEEDPDQEEEHLPSSSKRATTSVCGESSWDAQNGARRLKESHDGPPLKKRVSFDGVTVYYFHRSQGFTCVPSCGGTTLGMTRNHHNVKRLSLTDHEQELLEKREKVSLAMLKKRDVEAWDEQDDPEAPSGEGIAIEAEDDEEEEEEEEEEVEEGEVTAEDWNAQESDDSYYLQPLGTKERRSLLRMSGVLVEGAEKAECQMIRSSRQTCGCDCKMECRPDTCACAQNQIKCQVDRPLFPCGCSKAGCANPTGRVEFNPVRVRTHYIHTMMRVKMEDSAGAVPSPTHIRFDGADSYCDTSSSTEECSSPEDMPAETGGMYQAIPSFPAFYYASGMGSEQNRSYWHMDAGSYAAPSSSHPYLSENCFQRAGMEESSASNYFYSAYPRQNNGNFSLNNSSDSGFVETPSEGTYSLSSLYQHHNQQRSLNSQLNRESHFSSTDSVGETRETGDSPSNELACALKKSICGASG